MGGFYPEDLPKGGRLAHYAARLDTVELNNTFYRMPKRDVVARWARTVPDGFTFVLKASRRITHGARLRDAGESVEFLWKSAAELGDRLGPILFQLPPAMRADTNRLAAFLDVLPDGLRPVFEFRHASWSAPEVRELLATRGAALAVADSQSEPEPEVVPTADLGYFRLRRDAYTEEELAAWVERMRAARFAECFVFFKHEDGGVAPRTATRFLELAEA